MRQVTPYRSATEIAEMFNLDVRVVRNLCHARGQRFAYRLNGPKGKFHIDPVKFHEFIKERRLA